MDFVDSECQLLYKQNLETWFEQKDRTNKFSDENLEFVKTVQQKCRFKYDDNEEYDYREKFHLNGRFGHLYFTEPEPILFSVTELDGTVTLYKRRLEKEDEAESSESAIIEKLVKGSNYGGKILAYSTRGHIFMVDLNTRLGKMVAIWPIDPSSLDSGNCCSLIPYDPDIKAAVNGDFSLIAAKGPSDEAIQIRIFNLKTKECNIKTMKLSAGLLGCDIHMMSFNPCYPDLLYVSLYAWKSQYYSAKKVADGKRSDVDDDDGDDDDEDEDLAFVLFDLSTEQVLAEFFGTSLIPLNFFYETVESVTFLKKGTILVTYKVSCFKTTIVFLDAFSLEVIGSVNATGIDAVLGNQLLLSSCQSQFAIFRCQNLDSSNELKYDVEVYKIPDNDLSLKNFCRKVILDKVDTNNIDNLSLPNVLKNYLKL